jgi:hypothetical protein
MTQQEHDRFQWLCKRIVEEKDWSKYLEMIRELNALLEKDKKQS